MEELKHPFHDHSLILSEQKVYDEQHNCSGCTAPIFSGPFYICPDECKFVLHKSCAQLPKEITHFLHTQHSLTLFEKSTSEYGNNCNHCKESIKGFIYRCSICDFDLDMVCVSIQPYCIEPKDHKHTFIFIKPTSFKCDICGKQSDGKSYLCTTCQVHVHQSCASLPHRIKVFCHSHVLKLTFGFQMEQSIDSIQKLCKICHAEAYTEYGFYYCVGCEYIIDLECGTSKRYIDGQFDVDEHKNLSDNVFENDEIDKLVKHNEAKIDLESMHSHGMILFMDEPKNPIACDVCLSLISPPFYNCVENCGYFLHESCSELPYRIYHPLHEHQLILVQNVPWNNGFFWCDACLIDCNRMSYCCEDCQFAVDVKCGLLPDVLHNEKAHQHPIRLIMEAENCDRECSGCGSRCHRTKYKCAFAKCDYSLDFECVGLPVFAKHKRDKHPLALTYKSIEDELGGYYCDECEEPRDPNHWFYYCAICDRPVHSYCMGLHNLNLTRTYEIKEHPHPLTVAANQKRNPSCARCGSPCMNYFLQCADCMFYIHLRSHCANPFSS